ISRLSHREHTFDNAGIDVKININTTEHASEQKSGIEMYRDAMEEGNIYIRVRDTKKGSIMWKGSNISKRDVYLTNMDEGRDGMGLKRGFEKRNEGREESDAMAAKTRDESPEFG
ncbi:MAG: hypothetical protein Q9180_008328, partial [Flavoplaca navasiana]